MRRLQQSTSRVVMLKLFLTSDHVTAATGKTVAITISKNGGAFGNPNAGATNATEVSTGWYKVTLDTTDTNTVGDLVVRGTSASCDDTEQVLNVEAGIQQTGDNYARLGAPAGASVSADVAAVKVDTAAIKVPTDKLTFTVANQIDANVLDWKGATAPAMTGDAYAAVTGNRAEPAQGAPAATTSMLAKVDYLYKAWRNKKTQTATTQSLFADDASTVDQKMTVSDDGTTMTVGEVATGP